MIKLKPAYSFACDLRRNFLTSDSVEFSVLVSVWDMVVFQSSTLIRNLIMDEIND